MDWFSWLSRTGLEPSLIYEHGLTFSQNELEEEDISYFNHEFLQSMGISIAKHRLEILKLARRHKKRAVPHPMSRLLLALNKTKRSLSRCLHAWTRRHREDSSSAIVVVPSYGSGSRWRRGGSTVKRSKKKVVKQGRLLLTNGSPVKHGGDGFSSRRVEEEVREEDETYMIRWDTMFQDLKPT